MAVATRSDQDTGSRDRGERQSLRRCVCGGRFARGGGRDPWAPRERPDRDATVSATLIRRIASATASLPGAARPSDRYLNLLNSRLCSLARTPIRLDEGLRYVRR